MIVLLLLITSVAPFVLFYHCKTEKFYLRLKCIYVKHSYSIYILSMSESSEYEDKSGTQNKKKDPKGKDESSDCVLFITCLDSC